MSGASSIISKTNKPTVELVLFKHSGTFPDFECFVSPKMDNLISTKNVEINIQFRSIFLNFMFSEQSSFIIFQ